MYYAAAAALLGVGATMGGWVLLMTVVCRWFVRRRATAIGLAHMVSSLGPVFVLPFIFLVAHSEGWRLSAIMLGGFSLVVAFVALAWLRNRPEEMGLLPNGASVLPLQGSFSVFQALRTRAFWFIALADGLAAAEILKLTDFVGSLRASQAEVMVLLPTSFVFLLVGGVLGDRYSKPVVLASFTALQVVAWPALLLSGSPAVLYLSVALLAMSEGDRTPIRVAILADYFGTESLATIRPPRRTVVRRWVWNLRASARLRWD